MKKKLISLLFALSMLCVFMPVIATAATSGTCGNNLTWTLDNGTLIISGSGKMTDYNSPFEGSDNINKVIINQGVTNIGKYAFARCYNITSVTFPNSVTNIGENAFLNCNSLTDIDIGKGVTSISNNAFQDCTKLTNVTIPNSVKTIGEHAFYKCSKLTNITMGNGITSIGHDAFYNCKNLQNVYLSDIAAWCKVKFLLPDYILGSGGGANPLFYAKNLYVNNELITDLVIPDGITSIGKTSFFGCKGLTSVTIPDSVTSIGDYAFCGCSGLTSVTIPDSVTSIGEEAFNYCSGLTSVTIPSYVTNIGEHAFGGCYNLKTLNYNALNCKTIGTENYAAFPSSITTINIGEYVTNIPARAFWGCSIKSITIPDEVYTIGSCAFRGCDKLTEVNYNSQYCRSTYSDVFTGCTALKAVNIGDNCKEIPSNIFRDCISLTDVIFGQGETEIGSSSFANCSALSNINLSSGIKSIGGNAFENCVGLSSVIISNASIGSSAFSGCSELTSVTIGSEVTYIGGSAFKDCSNLSSLNYNATNCRTIGSKDNPSFAGCTNLVNINIAENIKTIPAYAFYGCSGLEDVYITDLTAWCNITFGDNYSNPMCYANNLYLNNELLTDLAIPSGLTNISDYVFYNCSNLTSVTIPESVTSIGDDAFYGCSGLEDVYITDLTAWCNITFGDNYSNPMCYANNLYLNNELLTDLAIPSGLTNISDYVFYKCSNLTSVTIPDSVTSIGDDAFYGCSGITDVYYSSTFADFKKISIGYYNTPLTNAKLHCSDMTIDKWGKCGNTVEYYLDDSGILTINGTGNMTDYNYNGDYSSPFKNNHNIKSIVIENGVTSIGRYAFYVCNGLTSVTIPDSITSVGSSAFYGCSGLEDVYITDLTTWCNITFDNNYSNPMYYANNLYLNNELLTDLAIPSGLTNISDYVFYKCSNLTSVTIPDSVTSIGDYAFYGCSGLTSVTIPDSVTSIGNYAFTSCDRLKRITFEDNRQTWGNIFTGSLPSTTTVYTTEIIEDMLIEEIPSMVYSSEELTPEPIIKDGEVILEKNQDYTISYYNNINAGTASLTITGTGEENPKTYAKYTGSKTISFNIEKANSKITTEPTAKIGLVYDGTAQELLTLGEAERGIIQYSLNENDNFSEDIPVATDAGIYTVYYKVFGDDNYNDSEMFSITVSIIKADVGVIVPTAKEDLIYNGNAQELINQGISEDGIIQYSFEENNNFSADIPTAINAGTYTIYYKVVGDKNHNDGEVYALSTKIAKAEPIITAPVVKENIVYNGEPQELVNAGSAEGGIMEYSFKENNDFSANIITAVNAGNYTVYYKVFGDENHNDSEVSSLEVIIEKAYPNIEKPDKLTALQGQILSEIELNANWHWVAPETLLNETGLYVFKAEYVPSDTNNYNTIIDNISVIVEALPITKSETSTSYIFTINLKNKYENCYVYASIYDENGVLLSVNRVPLEMAGNATVSVDKSANDALAKVFIWTDTLQPIITAEEFPLI